MKSWPGIFCGLWLAVVCGWDPGIWREELSHRGAENGNIFLSAKGREGARRTATPFRSTKGRRVLKRAPTRGAPTGPPLGGWGKGDGAGTTTRAGTRPAPTGGGGGLAEGVQGRRKGRHKACPYRKGFGGWRRGCRGDARAGTRPAPTGRGSGVGGGGAGAMRGQAQGLPLQEGVRGLAEGVQGRCEGRHKACPYGSGVVLPRFFCFLGVGGVWGKMVLLLRNILIFRRKQRVHFVQNPGQPPVRVSVYPGLGSRLSVPPWNGGRPGFGGS